LAIYAWVLLAHIVSIFGFLTAHGGASIAVYSIKGTRDVERLQAILDLSRLSVVISYIFVFLVLGTGVTLGFLGGYWGRLWIWTAIVVAFIMIGLMYRFGTAHFNLVRKAAGLPYYKGRKRQPPSQPNPSEIEKLLSSSHPFELSAVGVVGLLVIAWLMVFKPF
jgi:hypothetical protein